MKIGAMNSSYHKSLKKTLKFANEMGITGIQLNLLGKFDVDKLTPAKVEKTMKMLNDYSIEITAFCGDMGGHGFMIEKENRAKIDKTKRMIDLAKQMNVNVITTHIGIIPEDKTTEVYKTLKKAMTEIGEYAKANNIVLAIETGPEIATTLLSFIEDLNGGVGVNLDPANFVMVTGQDPAKAVHLLKDYIVHTHAKDGVHLRDCDPQEVYGSIDPNQTHKMPSKPVFRETPLGEGDINWNDYLIALGEIGYNGYLTIERETKASPVKTIQQAVDFLNRKLGKSKDREIVLAVVGCGSIANFAHFPAIRKIKNYKLKYCVDIIPERAEKAASHYGKSGYTKAITDYKEMLADREVDAVIVCTHTFLHAKIAIESMKAGKHVLSEKPMAMNSDLAEEMLNVSIQTGRISNVGVCMRFEGAVNEIKRRIGNGELGEIYSVYCSFRNFRNIPAIGGEFTNKEHSGGGVLFDWGVHFLDLIMYCIGEPKVKTASASTYSKLGSDIEHYKTKKGAYNSAKDANGVYDVEEFVTGLVRTSGPSISLNGAWAQNIDKNEMFVDFMGTKGGIRMKYCKDFELFTEQKGKLVTIKPTFEKKNMYELEHRAFVEDVLEGNHSRAYIGNLIQSAKILDGLYQSAQTNSEYKFS